jgi:hypothetical protein
MRRHARVMGSRRRSARRLLIENHRQLGDALRCDEYLIDGLVGAVRLGDRLRMHVEITDSDLALVSLSLVAALVGPPIGVEPLHEGMRRDGNSSAPRPVTTALALQQTLASAITCRKPVYETSF